MQLTYEYLKENNLILFEYITGSTLYNTNTKNSDLDIRYVYVMPKECYYSLNKDNYLEVLEENNNKQGYELSKYLLLLYKQNPTAMEMLNVPVNLVNKESKIFKETILDNKEKFITRKVKDTFGGYAKSQIIKSTGLNKKMKTTFPKQKKGVLDFCYAVLDGKTVLLKTYLDNLNLKNIFCGVIKLDHAESLYSLYYDRLAESNFSQSNLKNDSKILGHGFKGIVNEYDPDNTTTIRLSSIPISSDIEFICNFHYNEGVYGKYCKEFKEWWQWENNKNTQRYLENKSKGNEFDYKNMNHCIRLLNTCKDIYIYKDIINVRQDRELYLDIRQGKYNYTELMTMAETLLSEIEVLNNSSDLISDIDFNLIDNIHYKIRTSTYN